MAKCSKKNHCVKSHYVTKLVKVCDKYAPGFNKKTPKTKRKVPFHFPNPNIGKIVKINYGPLILGSDAPNFPLTKIQAQAYLKKLQKFKVLV